jgi:hypothetical protein
VPSHDIDLPRGPVGGVVLHYDLLRPYRRSIRTFARDPRCDLIKCADRVTFITLMPPIATLMKRLETNELSGRTSRGAKRQRHLAERYEDPRFLEAWYQAWMDYTAAYKAKTARHLLYHADGGRETIDDARNWKKAYAKAAARTP